MLTSNEIKNKKFDKTAVFGYKVEEVDAFMTNVYDTVTTLTQDKKELERKLEILAEKLEEYRSDEDSLRSALLSAQKLGDNVIKEAKNKAEIIMRDATIKAERMVLNAQDDIKREEVLLGRMKREVDSFRTRLLTLYKSHLELINALPEDDKKDNGDPNTQPEETQPVTAKSPVETESEPQEVNSSPAFGNQAEAIANLVNKPQGTETASGQTPVANGFQINGDKESQSNSNFKMGDSKFGPLKFGDGYSFDDDDDTDHKNKRKK